MKSNTKFVKEKIQKHIMTKFKARDYGTSTKAGALKKEVTASKHNPKEETDYKGGKRLADSGRFLNSTHERRKFINSLGINPKGKHYDGDEVNKMYSHLIGRETESILSKPFRKKRKKKPTKNQLMEKESKKLDRLNFTNNSQSEHMKTLLKGR